MVLCGNAPKWPNIWFAFLVRFQAAVKNVPK